MKNEYLYLMVLIILALLLCFVFFMNNFHNKKTKDLEKEIENITNTSNEKETFLNEIISDLENKLSIKTELSKKTDREILLDMFLELQEIKNNIDTRVECIEENVETICERLDSIESEASTLRNNTDNIQEIGNDLNEIKDMINDMENSDNINRILSAIESLKNESLFSDDEYY